MDTNHNRIKVSDLEKNEQNKILTTNSNGELEFSDINNLSYNSLDYIVPGKALDARQGKVLKDLIDTNNSNLLHKTGNESWSGIKSTSNSGGFTNALQLENNSTFATVLAITNNSTGFGTKITNYATGYGAYVDNRGGGLGIYVNNANTTTAYAVRIDNQGTGNGIGLFNSFTGRAIDVTNSNAGTAIRLDSVSSSTGDLLSITKNSVQVTRVDSNGIITTPTPSSNDNSTRVATTAFVTASLNSLADANALHKTGNENFSGAKTGTNSDTVIGKLRLLNNATLTGNGAVLEVFNSNTADGIAIENVGAGNGLYVNNNTPGNGNAIVAENSSISSTGFSFVGKNSGANTFTVNRNGGGYFASNVGIGVINPIGKLHIAQNDNNSALLVQNATNQFYVGNDSNGSFIGSYKNDQTGFANLHLQKLGGLVSIGDISPTARLTLSGFNAGAALDIFNTSAALNYRIGTGNAGGSLFFQNNAGTQTFAVQQNGNILIGVSTDDGTNKVQVNGGLKATTLQSQSNIEIGGSDLNSLNRTGFYRGSSLTNAPDTGNWFVTNEFSDANNIKQTLTAYGETSGMFLLEQLTLEPKHLEFGALGNNYQLVTE
jgi:hypothetical protein